ncbi:microsomal glutathione S-transferase 1-like [Saccostrea cucullata]|uniref:microsomal glutathione S-transferase 1-like n=1 Tax=Saccostrea cuccullata TaxID=36930 RepID=UPI002ECFE1F8
MEILGFDNPVFAQFAFYSIVLILKTLGLALLIIRSRIKRKVFAFPEDCSQIIVGKHHLKPTSDDAYIKRLRRCHLNNLENIFPFVTVGILYVLTEPEATTAALYFRIFLLSRVVYDIAFLRALPQPSRTFSYLTGVIVICMMAWSVLQKGTL